MKLILLAVVVLCAFIQVQGGCKRMCIPDQAPEGFRTCGDLSPSYPVEKTAEKRDQGSCKYDPRYDGTFRICCTDEDAYKAKRVNDLLGDLTGAEIGEYPHQVQLVGNAGTWVTCGGTIYNDEWIITAAHCIRYNGTVDTDEHKGYIIAGQTDVENAREEDKHYFQKIYVHEWFNDKKVKNGSDIALLHLRADSKLKFVKGRIQPLRVEPRDFKPQYGCKGLFMGFGVASKYGGIKHLQEAEAPIHEPSKAARLSLELDKDKDNKDIEPDGGFAPLKQHLSIGGDDSGYTVGQGDSGGPAVCADEQGKPVLCGISSFKQCELKQVCKRPSYFLRVAPFLDWIRDTTNGATQPEEWLVDEPMHPLKVAEDDIPGYLVRLTSRKKNCMGTIVGTDRLVTSMECIMEATGIRNNPNSNHINHKMSLYHYKSGRQLRARGVVPNGDFTGNVSSKIYEYLQRPLGTNDFIVIIITPEVGTKDVLPLPPLEHSINSPAVEYTMNEKTFSVETRRYLPMNRELCQQKVNALDKNLELHNSQLCMRRVYSAERECDRDIGGPLVCEGKYFCGQKSFHGCHLSAFPEIFNNHLDPTFRKLLEDSTNAAFG